MCANTLYDTITQNRHQKVKARFTVPGPHEAEHCDKYTPQVLSDEFKQFGAF